MTEKNPTRIDLAFEVNGEPHPGTHLVAWNSQVILRVQSPTAITSIQWMATPQRPGHPPTPPIPVLIDANPKAMRATFHTPAKSDQADVMWIEVVCEVKADGMSAQQRAVLLLLPEETREQVLGHDLQLLAKVRSLLRVAPILPDHRFLPLALGHSVHRGRLLHDATDMSFRRIAISWSYTVLEGLLKQRLRSLVEQRLAVGGAGTPSAGSRREELLLRVFFHDELEFREGSTQLQYRRKLARRWIKECPAVARRPLDRHGEFPFWNDDKATAFGRYLLLRRGLPSEASALDIQAIPRRSQPSSKTKEVQDVEDLVRRFLVLKSIRNLWVHSGTPRGRDNEAAGRLDTDISSFMLNPRGWALAAETVLETLEMLITGEGSEQDFAERLMNGGHDWLDDYGDAIAAIGELEPPPEPVTRCDLVAIQVSQLDKVRRWLTYEAAPEEASAYVTADRLARLERAGREVADALLSMLAVDDRTLRAAVEGVEMVRRRSPQWPGRMVPGIPTAAAVKLVDAVRGEQGMAKLLVAAENLRSALAGNAVPNVPFWDSNLDVAVAVKLAPIATQGRIPADEPDRARLQLEQVRLCALAYNTTNETRFSSYMVSLVQLFSSVLPPYASNNASALREVGDRIGIIGDARTAFKLFADDPKSADAAQTWRERLCMDERS